MDPYGSPDIIPNNSLHNPFPIPYEEPDSLRNRGALREKINNGAHGIGNGRKSVV